MASIWSPFNTHLDAIWMSKLVAYIWTQNSVQIMKFGCPNGVHLDYQKKNKTSSRGTSLNRLFLLLFLLRNILQKSENLIKDEFILVLRKQIDHFYIKLTHKNS